MDNHGVDLYFHGDLQQTLNTVFMSLNDSINALFKQGVSNVSLFLTDTNESVVVVKQQFPITRGGGQFQHEHHNTDWMLAIQDAIRASEHIAELKAVLIHTNAN